MLWGIYLTHSRGGLLALLATGVFAARRKIGLIPAVIAGGVMLVVALAAGMTGGRQISAESGADRIELWADGLRMVKAHLLFGVGLGNFMDYAPNTAHNSVVICAAELGIVGLICWVALNFTVFRAGFALIKASAPAEPSPHSEHQMFAGGPRSQAGRGFGVKGLAPAGFPGGSDFALRMRQPGLVPTEKKMPEKAAGSSFNEMLARRFASDDPRLPDEEIRRLTQLLLCALIGFLTAGWFLSRAFSIWLFIMCGMMHILLRMAAANGIVVKFDKLTYLLRWSVILSTVLLSIISLIIRVTGGH